MKHLIYSIFAILLISCDSEVVTFKTPQPEHAKPSNGFNRKIRGEYVNCTDSDDQLTISNSTISNKNTFRIRAHRNEIELDSNYSVDINNNTEVKQFFKKEGISVEFNGDTISVFAQGIDTIFQISEAHILKKFKGRYFLNTQGFSENSWNVKQLEIHKDTLVIGEITPSDTLLNFNFVKKTIEESKTSTHTEYTINPNKREFKKLLKPNTFKASKCYCKKK